MQKRFLVALTCSIGSVAYALLFAAGLSNSGCGGSSSSGSGGGSATCFDYSGFNKTSPMVTFSDVSPIFQNSCGLSSACHNADAPASQGYIGNDYAKMAADEINKASVSSSFKRIAPNDPEHSFMTLKVDGTFNCAGVQCKPDPVTSAPCGVQMPNGGPYLTDSDKDAIRRWIAQGALGPVTTGSGGSGTGGAGGAGGAGGGV